QRPGTESLAHPSRDSLCPAHLPARSVGQADRQFRLLTACVEGAMIRFRCPKCAKKLGVDESRLGGVAICPGCQRRLRISVRKNGEETGQAVYKVSRPTGDEEPFPPVRRRKRAEEEGPSTDYEDAEPRPVPRPRRNRRQPPAGLPWGLDGFATAILG